MIMLDYRKSTLAQRTKMPVPARDPIERFWEKVDTSAGPDGCWLWTGWKTHGYGGFDLRVARGQWRKVKAHRFAYELLKGPIPNGLEPDHLCRVRACVNPAHLEPVTRRVNLIRGETFVADKVARTHCPKGHALSGDNLNAWHLRHRRRKCETCVRERERRRGIRRKLERHARRRAA